MSPGFTSAFQYYDTTTGVHKIATKSKASGTVLEFKFSLYLLLPVNLCELLNLSEATFLMNKREI
jgi:hypothetical protein